MNPQMLQMIMAQGQGMPSNGQVSSPIAYNSPDYTQIGFNKFLERQPSTYMANQQLNGLYASPFISEADESGYLFSPFSDMNQINQGVNITGNQVSSGQITSNDGSMNIDLTNGNINFSNGVNNTTVDVSGVTTTPAQ